MASIASGTVTPYPLHGCGRALRLGALMKSMFAWRMAAFAASCTFLASGITAMAFAQTPRGDEQISSVQRSEVMATICGPASTAMFDSLFGGPLSWTELRDRVSKSLANANRRLDAPSLEFAEGKLREMWRHGLALPLLGGRG